MGLNSPEPAGAQLSVPAELGRQHSPHAPFVVRLAHLLGTKTDRAKLPARVTTSLGVFHPSTEERRRPTMLQSVAFGRAFMLLYGLILPDEEAALKEKGTQILGHRRSALERAQRPGVVLHDGTAQHWRLVQKSRCGSFDTHGFTAEEPITSLLYHSDGEGGVHFH